MHALFLYFEAFDGLDKKMFNFEFVDCVVECSFFLFQKSFVLQTTDVFHSLTHYTLLGSNDIVKKDPVLFWSKKSRINKEVEKVFGNIFEKHMIIGTNRAI